MAKTVSRKPVSKKKPVTARKTVVRRTSSSDFSLEDLNIGFHAQRPGSNLNFKPIKGFAQLVAPLFDPSDAVEPFAMEAMNLLGQSDQFGLYATQGMESMRYELSLVKAIKTRYGIEGLDINKFAMENKFKDLAKKIGGAIVAGFKKLILAISNFIKSIMNFIGGQIAKTQNGLKEKYDKRGTAWNGKATIKAMSCGKLRNEEDETTGVTAYNRLNSLYDQEEKATSAYEVVVGRVFKTMELDKTQIRQMNKVTEDKSGAKTIIDDFDKHFLKKGGQSPQARVNKSIFDSEKPVSQSVDKVLADIGIDILGKEGLAKAQKGVTNGRKAIAAFTKTIREIEKTEKVAAAAEHKTAVDAAKEKGEKAPKKAKGNASIMGQVRSSASYMTGMLLATFSAFLRCRGIAASAVRAGLSGKSEKTDRKSVV